MFCSIFSLSLWSLEVIDSLLLSWKPYSRRRLEGRTGEGRAGGELLPPLRLEGRGRGTEDVIEGLGGVEGGGLQARRLATSEGELAHSCPGGGGEVP